MVHWCMVWYGEGQAQRYQTPIRVFTKKTKDDTMVTGRIENKHIINYSEKLKKTGQFLSLKYKAYIAVTQYTLYIPTYGNVII